MANLTSIMAETSKSYDNSRNALNDQINAISGDLEAQKNRLNASYAQQQKQLDNQRNQAAAAASLSAARTGGSFGGKSAIANERYYQQAYVPAVTQMQTNQANAISSAEEQAANNKRSLEQTLAQLNDEANRYGLQRYDAAQAAEREEAYRQQQLELQRKQLAEQQRQFNQQLAAQNAYQKYLNSNSQSSKTYKNWDFGNGYSVQEMPDGTVGYYKDGKRILAGKFLENTGANWDKWNDIWANGLSTTGVGSDTINAYNTTSWINPNSEKYSYLYRW